MSREGRHRAERGDQAAQAQRERAQRMAAGLPSNGGGGDGGSGSYSNKHPLPVNVVTGQQDFFDKLAKALGISDAEHGMAGGGMGLGNLGKQFQVMVTETRAQTQVMNQLLKENQLTNQLLRLLGGGSGGGIGGTPPTPGMPPTPSGAGGGPAYNPYQGQTLRRAINTHYSNNGGRPASHFKFGKEGGHGTNVGSARNRIAQGIHQRFGAGQQPVLHRVQAVDAGGNPYTQSIREDPDGKLTDITMDDDQVASLAAGPGVGKMAASGFASGFAEGGVVNGLRAVPMLGDAIGAGEAVNKGAEWLTNQRAANAQYQSIYNQGNVGNIFSDVGSFFSGGMGGSTSGLGNRMGEEGFVLSNRFSAGGLDSQSARQLYQGVAGLGFSGAQQSQALQLGQQGYSSMGMPVDQWLQAVSASAQNLNGDLANLSQQMSTVSQAAVSTGQNANTLRDALIGNYQQVGTMVTGAGQSSLAGALTMANMGTSRAFTGMSESGMLSNPVTLNMIASSQGMTANQILTQANNGNINPLATGMQSTETSLLGNIVSAPMKTALSQFVAAHGGAATVLNSQNTLQNAGQAMMAASNVPPSMIPSYMQSIGMTPGNNIEDDYAKIAQTLLGSGVGGAASQSSGVNQLSGSQLSGANAITKSPTGFTQVTTGGQAGALQSLNASKKWGLGDVGASGTTADTGLQSWFQGNQGSGSATAAVSAYGQLESKYKVSDPSISKLIQTLGSDPNVGIEVTTSKGDEVVSLDNAVRLFPDQLASGTATIVGGQYDGKTVGEVSGSDSGKTPYGSSLNNGPAAGGSTASGKTTASAAWQQQHPDSNTTASSNSGGGSGTLTVDLTPAAQQLVTAVLGGNSNNTANAGGGVPTPASGVSH